MQNKKHPCPPGEVHQSRPAPAVCFISLRNPVSQTTTAQSEESATTASDSSVQKPTNQIPRPGCSWPEPIVLPGVSPPPYEFVFVHSLRSRNLAAGYCRAIQSIRESYQSALPSRLRIRHDRLWLPSSRLSWGYLLCLNQIV